MEIIDDITTGNKTRGDMPLDNMNNTKVKQGGLVDSHYMSPLRDKVKYHMSKTPY